MIIYEKMETRTRTVMGDEEKRLRYKVSRWLWKYYISADQGSPYELISGIAFMVLREWKEYGGGKLVFNVDNFLSVLNATSAMYQDLIVDNERHWLNFFRDLYKYLNLREDFDD